MIEYMPYDFDSNLDLVQSCERLNPNSTCAKTTCVLESHFVLSVYKNLELGHNIQENLIHENFDLESCAKQTKRSLIP